MLNILGTPSKPQCGFSLQTVRVLNAVGANFSSINVLEYPAVREGNNIVILVLWSYAILL